LNDIFIIPGAQRSGTTYLYKILDEHPEICMAKPMRPEPKFFCGEEYKNGKKYYLETYFEVKKSNIIYGEKSTSYMTNKIVPKRIKNMFPDIRLIFLLRNPIQRALSNYWFSVENGLENKNLLFAIKNEKNRVNKTSFNNISDHPYKYLRRGEYIRYINNYRKYFNFEQMLFIKSENLFNDCKSTLKKIYNFLDIKQYFKIKEIGKKINSAYRKKEVLDKNLIDYMIEYFEKPNKKLEKLTGINWKTWKEKE